MEKTKIKVEIETNLDEELRKMKELVSSLERANELILSLKTIEVKL